MAFITIGMLAGLPSLVGIYCMSKAAYKVYGRKPEPSEKYVGRNQFDIYDEDDEWYNKGVKTVSAKIDMPADTSTDEVKPVRLGYRYSIDFTQSDEEGS